MSNKNRKPTAFFTGSSASLSSEEEYHIIKFDLIKVVALNIVYLVVILGLYYSNKSSGFLDKWFAKVLHF